MKKTLGDYLIETYGENAIDLYWSDKNTLSPYDYACFSHKKIWIKCQKVDYHEDYEVSCAKFANGKRCCYCNGNKVNILDSFGYKIEQKFGKEYLENIWSNKNTKSPYEYMCQSNKKAWFRCLEKEYHEDSLVVIASFNFGRRCAFCANQKVHPKDSFAQYHIDNTDNDFLNKYWDYDKNKVDPFSISTGSGTYVFIKCQNNANHGSYKVSAATFTNGRRCGYCNGTHRVHIDESLGIKIPESVLLWSEKNDKTPYEYRPKSGIAVWWRCENDKHEDYLREINNQFAYNFKCPSCARERIESSFQEKTRLFLNEIGYYLKHENNCTIIPKNPKTKQNMPFDNEIVDLKLVVEVHGQQHYKEISGECKWTGDLTPTQYLRKRQLYDRYKRLIAHVNGYHYLEIPYWEFDDETYKQTIMDKIIRIKGEK